MSVSEYQYQAILQVIERLGSGLDSRKTRELAGLELLKLLRADYRSEEHTSELQSRP